MTQVFTFPGQGAQRVHMLQNLPDHPDVTLIKQQAKDILGVKLDALDSKEALTDTVNVQLALLICGVAWGRYLQNIGIKPDYVLGLSIGAYPAAVVAGSLDFDDALRLVKARADSMKSAYPTGYGMLAITGAEFKHVQAAVNSLQEKGENVYLANLNGEYQFVLAGEKRVLKIAAEQVRSTGVGASVFLDVTVPSHCPLLREQSEKLLAMFQSITLKTPNSLYVSAAKARVLHKPDEIKKDLALNMSHQLHWHDSCQMLKEKGVNRVLEMPPGSTLTGLFRKILSTGECYNIENLNLKTLL
ncbi:MULTISPECIES: ACP S-malonyltransferase [Marinomonas]|uniref:Malonyl CoA-acyl carrier protein transacylase n=1 Tax=Marinomonas rhodophyticola TaxID=2992803 RepID=A0ABT3KJY5_9GAMM|nr:malonate decarboxylase subunit epsilon [Marinomonas sp. KJ51-3]MCW4630466.1 malonate decarboxylase subunit epsilon [Marinomonas sp. KJ51-3]